VTSAAAEETNMSLNAVNSHLRTREGDNPIFAARQLDQSLAGLPADFASSMPRPPQTDGRQDDKTRRAFQDFVGQTFYGQMLKAMRKTVGKAAYFNGGQAEKIFQQQLDQVLAEKLSDATAERFSGPMYELFCANRRT
jgi:tRNA A37 threonylcarbamoyltransferase TsaD